MSILASALIFAVEPEPVEVDRSDGTLVIDGHRTAIAASSYHPVRQVGADWVVQDGYDVLWRIDGHTGATCSLGRAQSYPTPSGTLWLADGVLSDIDGCSLRSVLNPGEGFVYSLSRDGGRAHALVGPRKGPLELVTFDARGLLARRPVTLPPGWRVQPDGIRDGRILVGRALGDWMPGVVHREFCMEVGVLQPDGRLDVLGRQDGWLLIGALNHPRSTVRWGSLPTEPPPAWLSENAGTVDPEDLRFQPSGPCALDAGSGGDPAGRAEDAVLLQTP